MSLPSQEPRSPRYQSLDMWRGVACLCVVVYHSTILHCINRGQPTTFNLKSIPESILFLTERLWIGVPIFFVISGYCISATATSAGRHSQPVRTYLIRRFRRIYPPYWASIALYSLIFAVLELLIRPGLISSVPWAQTCPWSLTAWQWVGNLTLSETWLPHVVGGGHSFLIASSWTLCYEEQFYAVVGVFLLFARGRMFLAAAAVTALVVAAQTCLPLANASFNGFFFDGQWLLFASGILVFYEINYASKFQSWLLRVVLVVCAVLSICNQVLVARMSVGFVFAILISLFHPWDAWLSSRAWLKPLVFCGTMCYSMYLMHEIVVRIICRTFAFYGPSGDFVAVSVIVPLAVATSLLAGWAFHHLVERRFLNQPRGARKLVPRVSQLQGSVGLES
jgi:peptidoglycan/LPS O-acetylase OafA/YrhL